MKKALFAGTFYPPSLGHLDIILRATHLCDKLYVGVIENIQKAPPKISLNDRIEFLKKIILNNSSIEIVSFNSLVSDFVKRNKIDFLVRGFRSQTDLDQELSMAGMNRQLCGVDTIFLQADPKYAHLSSSFIREIASYGHSLHGLVPEQIEEKVFNLLNQ